MISGIYQIKNKNNGKVYIGKAKDIPTRWKQHQEALAKNIHDNIYLQDDYNLMGEKIFEYSILETIQEQDNIDKILSIKEAEWGNRLHALEENGYNIASFGNGERVKDQSNWEELDKSGMMRNRWTKVDNEIKIKIARDISANAGFLYITLLSHRNRKTGQCFPSEEVLSKETNIGIRTINKLIGQLEAYGYIKVDTGYKGRTNCYTFLKEDFDDYEASYTDTPDPF